MVLIVCNMVSLGTNVRYPYSVRLGSASACPRFSVHVFCLFFFFFFVPAFVDFGRQYLLLWTVYTLFTHCAYTVHVLKNIKNGSYDTIYTFKNNFATVFSVFSNNKFNPNTPIFKYIYFAVYQKNNVNPPNPPNSPKWNRQNLYQSARFRLWWVCGGLKFSQPTSDKLDRNIGLYPSNPTCVHPYGQVLSKKLFISWLVHLKCFYLTG